VDKNGTTILRQRTSSLTVIEAKHSIIVILTLYRMVMPIGTPFLKEKINN